MAQQMVKGRRLVVGDIHGAAVALEQVLERAGFEPAKDQLISLGDLTDYHPHSAEVIDRLLEIPQLISLRGNHDIWAEHFLETGAPDDNWIRNGGQATVDSFLQRTKAELARYLIFFQAQQRYHVEPHAQRLFVHASYKTGHPIELHTDEQLFWNRDLWLNANALGPEPSINLTGPFAEIFIGHTPTVKQAPDRKPVQLGNIWNLDQGIKRDGKLTLMDIDTKDYWQSDLASELYPLSC